MSSLTAPSHPKLSLPVLLRESININRPLTWTVIVHVILFVATIFLSIVDSRVVTGSPVWFKPMKFAVSIALYCATLIWMLSYVEGKRWVVNSIAIVTAVGFFIEIGAIFIQATRGVRSHFNNTTPFDAALYGAMGLFVMLIWVMNIVAAILLIRQKMNNQPLALGIRLGLLVTAVGSGLGFLMTTPTAEQMARMDAGETISIVGAHSVGVDDGGAGLPFTGWSVEGGDMRVPHFVGIHAMQIIPLLGLVLSRRGGKRLSVTRQNLLVWIGGLGYLGLVGILTWQAQRGQSIIAPDSLTLAAFGGLIVAVVTAATAVWVTKNN